MQHSFRLFGRFNRYHLCSSIALLSTIGLASNPSNIIQNKALSSTVTQLNDGNIIPTVGLGTFKRRTTIKSYIDDNTQPRTVEQKTKDKMEDIEDKNEFTNALSIALKVGYRHIDTAQIYRTETIIGDFLHEYLKNNDDGLTRQDIWITTKVSKLNRQPDNVRTSIEKSLHDLKTDYIDLFLIHSPHTFAPNGKRGQDVVNIYKILHEYKAKGKIRSVGVSNFGIKHLQTLERLFPDLPLPSVNQIEVNCFLYEKELIEYCFEKDILIEAYCPIARANNEVSNNGLLIELGKKYNKTWGQIMIKYLQQKNYIVITKSVKPNRIIENGNIFDFVISNDDMKQLDSLSQLNIRSSWNPLHEEWDV